MQWLDTIPCPGATGQAGPRQQGSQHALQLDGVEKCTGRFDSSAFRPPCSTMFFVPGQGAGKFLVWRHAQANWTALPSSLPAAPTFLFQGATILVTPSPAAKIPCSRSSAVSWPLDWRLAGLSPRGGMMVKGSLDQYHYERLAMQASQVYKDADGSLHRLKPGPLGSMTEKSLMGAVSLSKADEISCCTSEAGSRIC